MSDEHLDWTCIVCGTVHPINDAGFIAMACVGCERTASDRCRGWALTPEDRMLICGALRVALERDYGPGGAWPAKDPLTVIMRRLEAE